MNIHSADADYISGKWLVDMKVSKKEVPDTVQTLQLAMYFIMGKLTRGSGNPYEDAFNSMEGIEILNPRCGVRWRLLMDDVPEDVQKAILKDVMGGYDPAFA